MGSLSTAVERSIASATEFTKSLFAEDQWDAARVADFANSQPCTIATASERGWPHAAVIIAGCVDDEIYFTVHRESVLARNLDADARVAFSIASRANAVMGQGHVVLVGASLDNGELIDALATASASGKWTPPGWDGLIYRIDARRVFAN